MLTQSERDKSACEMGVGNRAGAGQVVRANGDSRKLKCRELPRWCVIVSQVEDEVSSNLTNFFFFFFF